MPLPKAFVDLGPGNSARDAAIDAIQRFALALDINDADLMRSAFTADGVLDKSGLSRVTGQEMPPDNGIDAILSTTFALIGPMDTSHHLSNYRVKFNGKQTEAQIMCHVYAQHFRAGEGPDPRKRDYILFGNLYYADVVKDGDGSDAMWKIKRMGMHCLWSEGDTRLVGIEQ